MEIAMKDVLALVGELVVENRALKQLVSMLETERQASQEKPKETT